MAKKNSDLRVVKKYPEIAKSGKLFYFYDSDKKESDSDKKESDSNKKESDSSNKCWKFGNVISTYKNTPSYEVIVVGKNLKPILNFYKNCDFVYIPFEITDYIKNPFEFYKDVSDNLPLKILIDNRHEFFIKHIIKKKPLQNGKVFNVSGLEKFNGLSFVATYFKEELSNPEIICRYQSKRFIENDKGYDLEW